MKTILVTGANGQLGNALRRLAWQYDGRYTFLFTDIDSLDIGDRTAIQACIQSNAVRYVINCAAYTAVDRAEEDEERCLKINRDAVRYLGEAVAGAGIKLIHISTDYVYDGTNSLPYVETDYTCPMSAYGRSKLAGERALQDVCPDAGIILRTSWLYSGFGNNFVDTILRLAKEREELRVVSDQIGTPTCAGDLASAILSIIGSAEAGNFYPGIFHYSNEGVCSWYDFALKIVRFAQVNCRVLPIDTTDYPTRAIRPQYSVLNKRKIKETYHLAIPHWEESLECMLHTLKEER
ncbi:MAG: dTDP-4-dehydrorhamnose reductase [Tannerellaceae bacterium]|jgi:dTDP-4-dehydrorhamnose reductase|nr:dTDP-4-dehydrorhamnose reductase [Tannerellaceae bacterium]